MNPPRKHAPCPRSSQTRRETHIRSDPSLVASSGSDFFPLQSVLTRGGLPSEGRYALPSSRSPLLLPIVSRCFVPLSSLTGHPQRCLSHLANSSVPPIFDRSKVRERGSGDRRAASSLSNIRRLRFFWAPLVGFRLRSRPLRPEPVVGALARGHSRAVSPPSSITATAPHPPAPAPPIDRSSAGQGAPLSPPMAAAAAAALAGHVPVMVREAVAAAVYAGARPGPPTSPRHPTLFGLPPSLVLYYPCPYGYGFCTGLGISWPGPLAPLCPTRPSSPPFRRPVAPPPPPRQGALAAGGGGLHGGAGDGAPHTPGAR